METGKETQHQTSLQDIGGKVEKARGEASKNPIPPPLWPHNPNWDKLNQFEGGREAWSAEYP